jgi:DNA-binding winged helix-turn-helix (wHTH) protein/tetratricopeptide (TPR) repeat protein
LRFGPFEANLATGELRKHGVRLKLHDQPFQVLAMLAARPGELVTREEIQQRLWPSGTFVDFENGLNSAVNRLREALSESPERPKFIETIPRRGYRFIAPVEQLNGDNLQLNTEAKPEATAHRQRRGFWISSAVAACVLVVAAFGGWRFLRSPKRVLNFGSRDWVLIANFENRTGNSLLDGSLEYALERELSNSQFVNVVPRERVGDVLRLMRKPLDAKIDAALGREICLRDGSIRALLIGRIEKLGTTYVLSEEIVNPTNGVAVASLSEEDPADSQMAVAVRRLSNRVRETLGEQRDLIQRSDEELEKVTTPSLHALQLYSQADNLMRLGIDTQDSAAALLHQAISEDPNFASAHLLLAYTYSNRSMDAKALPEFQRAVELADSASDRERFFILASHYDEVQKDTYRAIQAYEALLRLYPDHPWAASNLRGLYMDQGNWGDYWRLAVRLANLRPDSLEDNVQAACGMYLTKSPDDAAPYMQRARALAAADPKGPFTVETVEMLPVFYKWSQGDVAGAHSQFLQLQKTHKDFDYPYFLWSFGELAEADRQIRGHASENDLVNLAVGAYIKGDLPSAKKDYLQFNVQRGGLGGVWLLLMGRSGAWDEVEVRMRKNNLERRMDIVRGELFIARGRTQEGIALLEKGLDAMHEFPLEVFYLGSETLARTYERQGKFDQALRILLRAYESKGKTFICVPIPSGQWWLSDALQLADLYRKMGRLSEAEHVENDLRKMLVYADADHPIVRALKERASLSASNSTKK